MREIRIRAMIPSDFQHLGPLYREMVQELEQGYPSMKNLDQAIEDFEFHGLSMLRGNPNWAGFVAIDGNVAKGFANACLVRRVIGEPKVYALGETLFVTKNFRHHGLGERLVRTLCEWAVSQGAGALEVLFKPGTEAHKNWARMGFRSYLTAAVLSDKEMKPILDYPKFKENKVVPIKAAEG